MSSKKNSLSKRLERERRKRQRKVQPNTNRDGDPHWLLAITVTDQPGEHEFGRIEDALTEYFGYDQVLWLANVGYLRLLASEGEHSTIRNRVQAMLDTWASEQGFTAEISVTLHRFEEIFPNHDVETGFRVYLQNLIADLRHRIPEIDDQEAERLHRLAASMMSEPCVVCGGPRETIGWQTTGNPRAVVLYPLCGQCISDEHIHRVIKHSLDTDLPLGSLIRARNAEEVQE